MANLTNVHLGFFPPHVPQKERHTATFGFQPPLEGATLVAGTRTYKPLDPSDPSPMGHTVLRRTLREKGRDPPPPSGPFLMTPPPGSSFQGPRRLLAGNRLRNDPIEVEPEPGGGVKSNLLVSSRLLDCSQGGRLPPPWE